jgi:hypothetical protein
MQELQPTRLPLQDHSDRSGKGSPRRPAIRAFANRCFLKTPVCWLRSLATDFTDFQSGHETGMFHRETRKTDRINKMNKIGSSEHSENSVHSVKKNLRKSGPRVYNCRERDARQSRLGSGDETGMLHREARKERTELTE